MKLYTESGCTASDSVRIALNLKNIDYEHYPIERMAEEQAEQQREHPMLKQRFLSPVLFDAQRVHVESLAILEYLDETYSDPTLLPGTARDRIRVRALSQLILTDIYPLIGPRVQQYFGQNGGIDIGAWNQHWIDEGFVALEALLADNPSTGTFCLGNTVSLADVCLAPQVWHAQRLGLDIARYPTVKRIYDACMNLEEFDNVALDVA